MRIDILTLFPDSVRAVLGESILGRAAAKGILDIRCHQIRDYTENRQKQVDDYPYGGGWGQVMNAQPLKSCLDAACADAEGLRRRVIYMSPQGKPFNQREARRLKENYDQLVLVCGHYEGVDERFIEACVDEEISLGDFVLTGGEIAAMAVADCVCRMVPGVLADEACYTGESHWDGLLEYPQYTRPETWEGRKVPEVLLGGNHAEIEAWRREQSLARTMDKRPDMFEKLELSPADEKLVAHIRRARARRKLTSPITHRLAVEADIPAVMETESGHAEIDNEDTRGGIEFTKAEYEDVTENGVKADLEYLFIGNCLIAVRVSYDEGRMNYDSLMKDLTSKYGEAAAVDTAVLGNGIYVLDDDGRLKPDTMAFTSGDLMVIVEREKDDDGDEIAITYLDMTAAYITVK